MARNKYPDETVRKILDVSIQLFLKNGYDSTSLQDIINALGMSKGAIYHHFRSKEELFNAAVEDYYGNSSLQEKLETLLARTDLSGLEMIREILRTQLSSKEKQLFDAMYIRRTNDDPALLIANLRSTIQSGAPRLAEIIRRGNEDGSMHVTEPQEAAELLLIMWNVWLGEFAGPPDRFRQQLHLCAAVCQAIGVPVFDEEISGLFWGYYCAMYLNLTN